MSQIRHAPTAPTHAQARPAGDTIDRHRHDDHQLIYVSTGVLAIRTERGAWVASPERAVWVPAGVWHEHRFYGASSFHTVGFPVRGAPLPGDSPVVIAVDGLARELLIACTDPALPAAEAGHVRALLRHRLRRARVQALSLPAARDPRLAQACALAADDLSVPRSLDWLARGAGTSGRTLTRLFRTELGTTYPQWRTQVRVFQALIHLAGGASVSETGRRCGWATTSAFIDTFARTMGQTPGSYRAAPSAEGGAGELGGQPVPAAHPAQHRVVAAAHPDGRDGGDFPRPGGEVPGFGGAGDPVAVAVGQQHQGPGEVGDRLAGRQPGR
jgi:AraC-like DNA-binding protein